MTTYLVLALMGVLAAGAEWWTRPMPGVHAGSQTLHRSRPHRRPVTATEPYPKGPVVTAVIVVGVLVAAVAVLLSPILLTLVVV